MAKLPGLNSNAAAMLSGKVKARPSRKAAVPQPKLPGVKPPMGGLMGGGMGGMGGGPMPLPAAGPGKMPLL